MTLLCLFLWFLYFLAAYGVMFVVLLLKEYNGIKTFCTPSKIKDSFYARISNPKLFESGYMIDVWSDEDIEKFYKYNLRAMFLFAPITTPLFLIWLILWGTCTVLGYFSTIADWADPAKFEFKTTNQELEELRAELKALREGKS